MLFSEGWRYETFYSSLGRGHHPGGRHDSSGSGRGARSGGQSAAWCGRGFRRSRRDNGDQYRSQCHYRRCRSQPWNGGGRFPPGTVNGTIHAGDPAATQAQSDVATAYGFAAGQTCDANLSGQDLGGLTLPPGVYCFDSSAQLTGTLHLDAQTNPNAAWLFKVTSSLTTASNSAVVLVNGATPCNNNNVTWQVGSSATVGTATSFVGNVLANTSITFNAGANTTGSLYAHTGAVTMDTNNVSTCSGAGGKASPTLTTTPSGSVPAGVAFPTPPR